MGEEWRDIQNFPGYQVSNHARIRNKRTGRILRQSMSKGGRHLKVNLSVNGIVYTVTVHRIVAEAFVPNPNNKPIAAHKNLYSKSNFPSNLEWRTEEENNKNVERSRYIANINKSIAKHNHGQRSETHPRNRAVIQYDLDNNYIAKYRSISEAAKATGINTISHCCRGKTRTAGGYKWKYEI